MIGQTIGALSLSPSKSSPVSAPGADRPAAFTSALNSSTTTTSSPQPAPRPSPTGCQQQVVPSFTMICQPGTSAASSAPTAGGDLGAAQNPPLHTGPAQVAPALASPSILPSQPSHTSGLFKESSLFSQLAPSKTQISASPNPAATTQFSTSSTGTIQQRIVINTSAPLAGGTQILLNNARFVVPPQGLGPGSHVLIISSPAPQQVPPASPTSTGSAVPLQRAAHDSTASPAPVSPHSPVRLSTAPAASYPFVASSLRANAADVEGSAVFPGKPNGNFAPPTVGTPTLVPFPPRLGAPGLLSSVANRVPVASPAPVNKTPAGTPAQAECSPALAHALSRMSTPVSSLPVVASPLIPASSVIARTPALVASVTAPGPVLQPQQGAAASSIHPLAPGPLHIRLENASVKHLGPALMQTVLTGARTQVPPAMAIPSSRMQTLPIATVPPIGSIVHTFESTPMVAAPSSSSTVLVTSAQPISSLQINNPTATPALTAQALGKLPLAAASKGIHANVASRLLISPDGAVLNTLQCQASAAELAACSGTKDSRVVFHNSSTGELRTHDSEFQPSQAGRS